jgi:hypothetical protein
VNTVSSGAQDTGAPAIGMSPRLPAADRVSWSTNRPFLAVHAGCLLLLWTGISPTAAVTGLAASTGYA